jgi:S1-C subfamily serine protease
MSRRLSQKSSASFFVLKMSGVVLLNVTANSAFSKSGLKVGDVILQCQDSKIQYFNQLLRIVKDSQYLSELNLVIQRNQIKKTIQFSLQ